MSHCSYGTRTPNSHTYLLVLVWLSRLVHIGCACLLAGGTRAIASQRTHPPTVALTHSLATILVPRSTSVTIGKTMQVSDCGDGGGVVVVVIQGRHH